MQVGRWTIALPYVLKAHLTELQDLNIQLTVPLDPLIAPPPRPPGRPRPPPRVHVYVHARMCVLNRPLHMWHTDLMQTETCDM